jgi:pimeloyl-ACP methyl ester carboxylesterase
VEQGPRGAETLVLLHGITDSWRSYEPVLPFLRRDRHVISVSVRGHGGSDKTVATYRIRDFAEDVADLAAQLALPAFTVVGHSMGSAVALRLALDRPDLIRGVVAAGAFASFADKPGLDEFIQSTIMTMGSTVPREIADAFQRDTIAGPVAPGLLEAMIDECLRTPAAVWRAAFAGLSADNFDDEVDRIAAPVLLVWGDVDAFVPEADQQRLAQRIPQAARIVYQGVGHAVHWEQPERFALDVDRFVDSLDRLEPRGHQAAKETALSV